MVTVMDPSPPRRQKDLPFYEAPQHVTTSARIVSAARDALRRSELRAVPTRRPETPHDGQRKLFPNQSVRDPTNRPASTFSLGSRHFDCDSRPVSGTRLSPIDHVVTQKSKPVEGEQVIPKPPADPNRSVKRPASRWRHTPVRTSSNEQPGMQTGSLSDVSVKGEPGNTESDPPATPARREVREVGGLDTQEHVRRLEERGEGDGSDVAPRVDSRSGPVRAGSGGPLRVRSGSPLRIGSGGPVRTRSGGPIRAGSGGPIRAGSGGLIRAESGDPIRVGSGGPTQAGSGDPIQAGNGGPTQAGSGDPIRAGSGGHIRAGSGGPVRAGSGGPVRAGSGGPIRAGSGGQNSESGYNSDRQSGSAGSERESSTNRKGSGGRRTEGGPEATEYYTTHVAPIVDKMASHITEKGSETLYTLANALYEALDKGSLLGKACGQRAAILKTLFKLLDLDSPKLLLKLATLILALKVSGNNLLNVCKLIFKVSRDEKNDSHFLDHNLLDLLVQLVSSGDHLRLSPEALVYAVGALKFLSGGQTVAKLLVKRDALSSLAQLLTTANQTVAESGKIPDQFGHILVQLTATLRNLTDVSSTRPLFLSAHILPPLCRLTQLYASDADLVLNVCRVLSKLTQHTDCCSVVSDDSGQLTSFIHLLRKYSTREDLVVRIGFILGNLTTKNESCRQRLNQQPEFLETILHVLTSYLRTFQETCREGGGRCEKTEDVLIKLVRVIANVAMSPEVGPLIAQSQTCVDLLIQILESADIDSHEELVLNTVTTVNNLSYYTVTHSAIVQQQIPLSTVLLKYLAPRSMVCLAETTRVFGNLSRERAVRDYLIQQKVDEAMIAMLDSDKIEVVFTACGVLINLMADEDKRATLKTLGGIQKLTEVLRDWGQADWQLATMVCQTLWNCTSRIHSTNLSFGERDAHTLANLLLEYLDEETALGDSDASGMREFVQEAWETQFCPVASQLLRRIESHQSKLEPLDQPS